MAYSKFHDPWNSGSCCGTPDPGPDTPLTKAACNHWEQGIFDAAAVADDALADAAAAQADATSALANAAAAQSTANTAQTNAATAQTAASNAQSTANTAQTNATSALAGNITASSAPSGYDVILLAGQSNMVGFSSQAASASLDPAVAQIFQLKQDNTIVAATEFLDHPSTPTGVGPGFPFARQYVKQGLNRGRKVLLVPSAVVATHLVSVTPPTWNSTVNGSLLDAAITRANTAIASEPGSKIVAVLWLQGGADASDGATQVQYANAVDALITKVRANITGASGVPFILSSEPPEADAVVPNMVNIRAALVDTPNRNTKTYYVAPPSNMVVAGNIHFSNAGARTVGQRMFDGFQAVRAGIYVDSTAGLNTTPFFPVIPPNTHQSGRFFTINSTFSAAGTPTLNELRVYPWPVFVSLPLAGLFCQITTSGSADSLIRLGIYADDGSGVPSSLVMDLGTLAGNAAPGVYTKAVPSSITLPPGLYWAGAVTQGTTSPALALTGVTTQPTMMYYTPLFGGSATFTASMGYRQTGVSGTLPPTFASSGAVQLPVRLGYQVA